MTKKRPVGPDDLIPLGLALGVLTPRRRRSRPARRVGWEAALHAAAGAVVLSVLFAALVILGG